jgi:predicted dehydrogenase
MAMPEGFPFTTSLEVTGSGGIAVYRSAAAEGDRGGRGDLEIVTPEGPVASSVDPGDPFVAELGYFLTCASSGQRPERADVRSAALALQVALAAKRSFDSGRPVELAPLGDD